MDKIFRTTDEQAAGTVGAVCRKYFNDGAHGGCPWVNVCSARNTVDPENTAFIEVVKSTLTPQKLREMANHIENLKE